MARLNFFFNMSSARTLNPDFWYIYLLDIVTLIVIILLIWKKIITVLNGISIYSIIGFFYTFYTLCWSRVIIKNIVGIIRGFLFGFNDALFIGSILVIAVIVFLLLLYTDTKRVDLLFSVIFFLGILLVILLYHKYHFKSTKTPEASHDYQIEKIIENSDNVILEIPNLNNGTDIRVLKHTKDGFLIGAGGNWLVDRPRDVIFVFNTHKRNYFKKAKGWEIKELVVDESRHLFYFADFSRKTIEKWSYPDLANIILEKTDGVIQHIILSDDGEYIYAVYDDRLFIDKFRTKDLKIEMRFDIGRSGICTFGSLGMTSIFADNAKSIVSFYANCDLGIIKYRADSLEPVLLARPDDDMIWSAVSSVNENKIYISYPARPYIVELDGNKMTVTRKISIRHGVRNLLLSSDNRTLYATNYFTGEIYFIDLKTGKIRDNFLFPRKCYAITEDPISRDIYIGGPPGVWKVRRIEHQY
ncbi:MAG: hypothetical protein N2746_05900 [Deltaproteobacteria bacterium]|nr:hypothetical protein [Deltaproteobacteria bacterium]